MINYTGHVVSVILPVTLKSQGAARSNSFHVGLACVDMATMARRVVALLLFTVCLLLENS
jgi:hypothetical protein